ncbi:MAG: MG2 domain-containing protein, partial [Proteobacteria bacterium]|nr:MG2 domain-containing protein [Pseudomonadota bacterium]
MGTPTGEVEARGHVQLTFSRPMVARDKLKHVTPTPPVTFTPALAAEATWTDDKTLVLVPTATLPISTRYVARVAKDTRALDGHELADDYTFEFFTERLTGEVDVIGSVDRAAKDQVARVAFTQEVALDQVLAHCSYAGGAAPIKVKLAPKSNPGPTKVYAVVPEVALAADTAYRVTCSAGLVGTVGNLGIAAPLDKAFHTYGPLTFASLEPSGDDIVPDENLKLALAFSNPLAEPYQLTLTPPVVGFPQRCHALGDEVVGLSCGVQLEPRTAYTLTIDAKQLDIFGQALAKPQTIAFKTTDAKPTISMESGYFVAELTRPVIPIWTRNVTSLDVRAVEITPANFHELRPHLDWWEAKPADLKKTKLVPHDKKLAITGTRNTWGQHSIGAMELLGTPPGPGMYYVEVGASEVAREPYEDGGRQKVLVNFTDIGVVSKLSGARGLVWTTRLSTGKPLPGATVTVRDGAGKVTWTGTTDGDGVAVLPGTGKLGGVASTDPEAANEHYAEEREGDLGDARIFASFQNDWTMVSPTRSGGLAAWNFNVSSDYERTAAKLRGFMHTDRGLYRPGDKVHVKGLARLTKLGEPLGLPPPNQKVQITVSGPQGKTFVETEAKLSAFGGFWFDLELPGDARLGDYAVRAQLPYGTFTREFSVEEYRPATFEVTGKATETQIVRRGEVHAAVAATYFYGAPLRTGEVAVAVHSRPRRVEFAQLPGFAFADEHRFESSYDESSYAQTMITEEHAALDATGKAAVAVAITPNELTTDADLLVRANVTSPSNEVITKTFTIPYFHARKYFGIKTADWFVDVAKPTRFAVIAVGPDGKVLDGPAKVTVTRRDWNCVWEDWGYRGNYQCKDTVATILEKTVTIAGKPTELEFTPPSGGNYWIEVASTDDKDEAALAATALYAYGDGGGSWESTDTLSFGIVADKKTYKVGDTATLLLKTDLANATGLVTIERDGVIEQRLVEITPKQKTITVPITANFAPNMYVSVALVQGRTGEGVRGKPRMRMGIVNLPVQPTDNRLTVTVATDQADYRPGAPVTATVKVVDAAGKPVAAEVSITAADEGVLSLIGYETPDPVPTFYAAWGLGVSTATQLEYLRDIPGPNVSRPATGGDAPGTLRQRFISTPVWAPGVVTNAAGIATVTFPAPDNLTAYRMMAVAADKATRFGSGDKRFTVSKPLQLHEALPRFARVGDTLRGGVVVHNETGGAGTATVKLVASDGVKVTGDATRTLPIGKDANVPVLFDLAAIAAGDATLTFSVTMGSEADAVKFDLPISHPSPVRDQPVADGAAQVGTTIPLVLPANAIPGSVEVVVSVDPDGLSGMEDSLRELVGYPYGCLEQTTSKVIPMIAARDLAESLAIDGLTGPKLDAFVKAGLGKIGRHQTTYGGFSLWPGGEPDPYYTAYALWGLHQARQAGFAVDQQRIDDGLQYLKNDGEKPDEARPHYDPTGNLGSQAFALYVRAVLGDKSAQATAATLSASAAKLPIYGKAFLARALAAGLGPKDPAVVKLVTELGALATVAGKADVLIDEPGGGSLYAYMSTSTRTTAVVLATLAELAPKHPALAPLVHALIKARRAAPEWDTQSNVYTLVALQAYARTVTTPPPSVTVAVGGAAMFSGTLAGKQRLRVLTAPFPTTANPSVTITPKGETR